MFALLRANVGRPIPSESCWLLLKITILIHIYIVVFNAVWLDVTFGLLQLRLSSRCRNTRADDVPKPSHGLTRRDARRPPK